MVYDREGRSHSSPGYSYSGRNYHREKTPEEKEQERVKEQKRLEQKALEQEVKTSSKILPAQAQELVQQGVVKEATLWREFLQTLGGHFDTEIVAIIATTTVDGVLPFGDLVAAGVALSIAVEIYQNWNPLWSETISQIVTTAEPGNQVYETPTDEQIETERHTGHAPEKVETGTPGYDTSQQVETPRHTGHETEKPVAEDFIMESRRRNVEGHDREGGHTADKHIGKSVDWLRKRAQDDKTTDTASSFNSAANANLTQARFVKENKNGVKQWLQDEKRTGVYKGKITMDREIGIVVDQSGKVKTVKKAFVVLGKNNSELGYRIVTSFPIP